VSIIRIVIADDHQLIREGLRGLLDREPDMEVVGEAQDGRAALGLVADLSPEVVIMDVAMPDLNGIEATRKVIAAFPAIRVIALSMHSDKRFVAGMLKAGASGYLLKDCAFSELASAVRTVAAGKVYLSPGIAGLVAEEFAGRFAPDRPALPLTDREREVLQLIAEGQATKRIAARLGLSVKTVETHRRQMMDKLGLHSVAELTKYAIREGLTSLEP
jgi:NarL family two-component system response regulator LiaR